MGITLKNIVDLYMYVKVTSSHGIISKSNIFNLNALLLFFSAAAMSHVV